MTLVIMAVVFTSLAFIALSISVKRKTHEEKNRFGDISLVNDGLAVVFKVSTKSFLSVLIGLFIISFGTFMAVPANSVGIVFNEFTGVKEEVMTEGFHFKTPFEKIYVISTEVRTKEVQGVTGQTKDAQWIAITMDIKYRVSVSNAFEVFRRFKSLDKVDSTLLSPLVQRAIESVTTKYNVIDILGEKRNEVYLLIEQEVKTRLAESGIEFFSLVLTDTDAGEAIEKAIEQEAVAKKAVETALQAQAKAEIEAQTKVLQAEAAAEVTLIEADAKAKVVLIEAEAAAEANRLLSKSITPEILKKMEMEARIKWGWITISGAQLIVDAE